MKKILASLIFFLGCNTLPVGFDQFTTLPETRTFDLPPDTVDSYGKYIPLGLADYLLLGKDDGYESRILIKFPVKDSSLDSVTKAQLVLNPIDTIPIRFVCRACSTDWSIAGVTWLMADSFNRWFNPGGDYHQFTLGQGSLARDSTVVDLNLSYLGTFVRESYGIIILPVDTGFTTVVNMNDTKKGPRLILTYADGKKRRYMANSDAHIVDTSRLRIALNDLLVGASFAFRTFLKFNLDSLPPEATIISAQLSFQPQTIYRREDTLRLGIHRIIDSYYQRGRYAKFDENAAAVTTYSPASGDTTLTIEIRQLVQKWVSLTDSYPNNGILITAEPEWRKPFRIKLSRSGTYAPRLKIQYAMPAEDRFSR